MKNRKKIALNKLFNFCVIIGLFLVWMAIEFLLDADSHWGWGLGFGIAGVLFILLPMVFTPYCYIFDREGVSFHYVFLPVERYLWENVRSITVEDIDFARGSSASIFEFFYGKAFHIQGSSEGPCLFYMTGNIRKSFRTKRLLEEYWDGTITGYLFEGFQERKRKKQAKIKAHLADEVVPMEQEVRTQTREWLEPYIAQARLYDLNIKAKYLFITKDYEEYKARPKEGYTYTLVAEIAHYGEKDENRIVMVDIDLVYVRLGKKSYRGVKNPHIQEEFQSTFTEVLNEIFKNGIEAYCE